MRVISDGSEVVPVAVDERRKKRDYSACIIPADRLLLGMDEDIEAVGDYLEALHMMALDIGNTPPEDATAAFRTIAQAAIDRCAALRKKGWQASDILRGKSLPRDAVALIEAGDAA